jgi:hypothetical protein
MTGDIGGPRIPQRIDAGRLQEVRVAAQVAPVGGERVTRQPTLDREMVEVGVDGPVDAQLSTSAVGRTGMPCASATGP